MYQIFFKNAYSSDGSTETMIYNGLDNSPDNLSLIDAKLSLEVNKSGKLEFTIPHSHKHYSLIDLIPTAEEISNNRFLRHIVIKRKNKFSNTDSLLDHNDNHVVDDHGRNILGNSSPTFEWYWEGRILSINIDINLNKKVVCEGVLGYLNDVIIPPDSWTTGSNTGKTMPPRGILNRILTEYNKEKVDQYAYSYGTIPRVINDVVQKYSFVTSTNASKNGVRFHMHTSGNVDPYYDLPEINHYKYEGTTYYQGQYYTHWNSCFDALDELILSRLNGYVKVTEPDANGFYLELHPLKKTYTSATAKTNGVRQYVNFGHNLLDYNKSFDLTNLFTVIIPLGPNIEFDSTQHFMGQVSSENLIRMDFWRYKATLKGSDQPATMRVPSAMYFSNGEYNQPKIEVTYKGSQMYVYKAAHNMWNDPDPGLREMARRGEYDPFTPSAAPKIYDDTSIVGKIQDYNEEQHMPNLLALAVHESNESASTAGDTYKRWTDHYAGDAYGIVNVPLASKFGYIAKTLDLSTIAENIRKSNESMDEDWTISQQSIVDYTLNVLKKYGWTAHHVEGGGVDDYEADIPIEWEIELSAYDLSILDNNLESIDLYDVVECMSSIHNMSSVYLQVTKLEIDLLQASSNKVTLGTSQKYDLSEKIKEMEDSMDA